MMHETADVGGGGRGYSHSLDSDSSRMAEVWRQVRFSTKPEGQSFYVGTNTPFNARDSCSSPAERRTEDSLYVDATSVLSYIRYYDIFSRD